MADAVIQGTINMQIHRNILLLMDKDKKGQGWTRRTDQDRTIQRDQDKQERGTRFKSQGGAAREEKPEVAHLLLCNGQGTERQGIDGQGKGKGQTRDEQCVKLQNL